MTSEDDDRTAEKTTNEETDMSSENPQTTPDSQSPEGTDDAFRTDQPDAEPTRPVPAADRPTEPVPDASPAGEPAGGGGEPASPPPAEQPQPTPGWTQQQSASPGYAAPDTAAQAGAQYGGQYGGDQYGAGQYGAGQYQGGQYPPGQYPSGQYGTGGYAGGAVPPGGYPPSGYPGGYQPGGYPPPGYGYPATPPRTDDKAIWALVSSIAGFVLFPLVLHIVGWVLANQSLRTIRESGGAVRGEGVAKTARVLGIVGVVLSVLGLIAAVLFFAIAIPLGIFAATTSDLDIGTEQVTPTSLTVIDGESFSHDIGEVTYDLSGLDFAGRAADMSVELGAGTLTIEVPDDVTVNLDAEVGAGDLDVFGTSTSGIEVSREGTFDGDESGEGVLDLTVRVDVGELEVSRG